MSITGNRVKVVFVLIFISLLPCGIICAPQTRHQGHQTDNPVLVDVRFNHRTEENAKNTADPSAGDDSDDTYYEDIETLFPEKWANGPDMFGEEAAGEEDDVEAPAFVPGGETKSAPEPLLGTPFIWIQQQSGGTGPDIPRVIVEP